MEAMFNIPSTAHILGGAVIAPDPSGGVVDADQRVFGYENLLVCDGAAIPANVGVNPSLTITALAEHAMSRIEANPEALLAPDGAAATPYGGIPAGPRLSAAPLGAVAHEHHVLAAGELEAAVRGQVAHDERLHAGPLQWTVP